jgi:hypothetical protein
MTKDVIKSRVLRGAYSVLSRQALNVITLIFIREIHREEEDAKQRWRWTGNGVGTRQGMPGAIRSRKRP